MSSLHSGHWRWPNRWSSQRDDRQVNSWRVNLNDYTSSTFSFNHWFEALVACACEREVKMMVQCTSTGWWMKSHSGQWVEIVRFEDAGNSPTETHPDLPLWRKLFKISGHLAPRLIEAASLGVIFHPDISKPKPLFHRHLSYYELLIQGSCPVQHLTHNLTVFPEK